MKSLVLFLSCLGLAAPALAQQSRPQSPFSGIFTPWSGTSRDSLRAESEARQAPQPNAAPVAAQRTAQVALGERVAEAVRRGDCAEGERIAREAGDFPLVRAVRDYCRTSS